MRAHDLEMANEILEPVLTFMRAQTDSSRLINIDLKEYFDYREPDVGKGYVASLISVPRISLISVSKIVLTSWANT